MYFIEIFTELKMTILYNFLIIKVKPSHSIPPRVEKPLK